METISATDLARHTREILDKVVGAGETVAIERNNTLIAQIGPPQRQMTAAQALAGLPAATLTLRQSSNWLKESREDFGEAVRNPWE